MNLANFNSIKYIYKLSKKATTYRGATNNGALISGAAASNVSSVVPYTAGNGSAYLGQIVTSTGVTGLTATLAPGNFANGNGTLTYTITGTPLATGNATFALNIGGQTCSLTRVVTTLTGSITELNCAAASTSGTLNANQPATGVIGAIPYTGGNSGVHSGLTQTSTGVTGLTLTVNAGTFANGNGTLEYTITGTPSTTGNATFGLSIGGRTCTLTRVVNQFEGSISALNCSFATSSGILVAGVAASGVSSSIPYTGGNGGNYAGQTVNSTGGNGMVTGLTATLTSGTFANGNGSLIYTITGTPSGSGVVNFALNIGGRTCTLAREVILNSGTISALNCNLATNSGTLVAGVAASGVSSSIPYTGGNGGSYIGQTVSSTGVTGLTATLASGTFANGSGSLSYTITGIPSGSGTASFALSIGGRNCTLSRTIEPAVTSSYPANTVFCSGIQAAIVPVTSPASGRTWMDRNLGASRPATSLTDAESFGDLYQWGRRADGHQCRNSTNSTSLSSSSTPSNSSFIVAPIVPADWRSPQNSNLWQGVSGTNNPCPSGYRLPTKSELNAEVQFWVSKNNAGAFSSVLKLPGASYRSNSNGEFSTSAVGAGLYWTSSINGTYSEVLIFDTIEAAFYENFRANGFSVRCIKN